MQRLWVPGPLPGLNDILDARMRVYSRGRRKGNAYSDMKKHWGMMVRNLAASQGFGRVTHGAFTYLVRERDRMRDPSNFVAGAVKIMEDALQEANLLAGDGWKQVLDFRPHWLVDAKRPGVTLFVTDRSVLDFDETVRLDDEWRQR